MTSINLKLENPNKLDKVRQSRGIQNLEVHYVGQTDKIYTYHFLINHFLIKGRNRRTKTELWMVDVEKKVYQIIGNNTHKYVKLSIVDEKSQMYELRINLDDFKNPDITFNLIMSKITELKGDD